MCTLLETSQIVIVKSGLLCARQVIDDLSAITLRDGMPLEAVITEGMHHPNIVNTLAHCVQLPDAAPAQLQQQQRPHDSAHSTACNSLCAASSAAGSGAASSSAALSSSPKSYTGSLEHSDGFAWLLLEYCNMGCLQVRLTAAPKSRV